MNWTMPYPWRSRSDSVRRINMSSEPGNESFFCALRPIPRILSLRWRDARVKFRLARRALAPQDDFGVLTRTGCESLGRVAAVDNDSHPVRVSTPKSRSEEHTSELQSQSNLVCRL